MEHEDISRGQAVLTAMLVLSTGAVLLIGRKKLSVAIPAALVAFFIGAMMFPGYIPARPTAQRCIANLRAIRDAKAEWLRKHGASGAAPVEADLLAPGGTLRHPISCPRGGVYNFGQVGQNPSCTFSNKGHRLDDVP